MKKLLLVILCIFICGCGNKELIEYDGITYYEETKKTNYVLIEVEDYGNIIVKLDKKNAPITVKNFKKLVSENFYDNVTFHRVVEDFVIQAGDASSLGRSADTIVGEFSSNGYTNNLSHTRGVISMARTSVYDSASSQFFIVLEDATYLDGEYAAFGTVIAGMDVVDKIGSVSVDDDDKPLEDIVIKTMKFISVK